MPMRITPLRKALANTGPIRLPGHPVVGGVVSIFLGGMFGALAMIFFAPVHGVVAAIDLYQIILKAAFAGVIVSALVHIHIFLKALSHYEDNPEDAAFRIRFVMGGGLGFGLFVVAASFTYGPICQKLETIGPIFGP